MYVFHCVHLRSNRYPSPLPHPGLLRSLFSISVPNRHSSSRVKHHHAFTYHPSASYELCDISTYQQIERGTDGLSVMSSPRATPSDHRQAETKRKKMRKGHPQVLRIDFVYRVHRTRRQPKAGYFFFKAEAQGGHSDITSLEPYSRKNIPNWPPRENVGLSRLSICIF